MQTCFQRLIAGESTAQGCFCVKRFKFSARDDFGGFWAFLIKTEESRAQRGWEKASKKFPL
jgi:hypothetical protein